MKSPNPIVAPGSDNTTMAEQQQAPAAVDGCRPALYLNITILDHSKAVKRKVGIEIDKSSRLPPRLKEMAKRTAGNIASDLATSQMTVKKMGEKMGEKLPRRMRLKGVDATAEVVFQEGPYAVLRIRIREVRIARLANPIDEPDSDDQDDEGEGQEAPRRKNSAVSNALQKIDAFDGLPSGPSEAWGAIKDQWEKEKSVSIRKLTVFCFLCLFWVIGPRRQKRIEGEYLPKLIQAKMDVEMTKMIRQKMEQKHMEAEVVVLQEDKQAGYFYDHLQRVRQIDRKGKLKPEQDENQLSSSVTPTSSSLSSSLPKRPPMPMPIVNAIKRKMSNERSSSSSALFQQNGAEVSDTAAVIVSNDEDNEDDGEGEYSGNASNVVSPDAQLKKNN